MKQHFECHACHYSFDLEVDPDRDHDIFCPLCGECLSEVIDLPPKTVWESIIDFFGVAR